MVGVAWWLISWSVLILFIESAAYFQDDHTCAKVEVKWPKGRIPVQYDRIQLSLSVHQYDGHGFICISSKTQSHRICGHSRDGFVGLGLIELPIGRHIWDVCSCTVISDCDHLETCFEHAFVLVPKVDFVPSGSWKRVEEWQSVPPGLEIKMSLEDGAAKYARIPSPWVLKLDLQSRQGDTLQTVQVNIFSMADYSMRDQILYQLNHAGFSQECVLFPPDMEEAMGSFTQLFEFSRKAYRHQVFVALDGSRNCACAGMKQSPCIGLTKHLEKCYGNVDRQALEASKGKGFCEEENKAYLECTKECSSYGDALFQIDGINSPTSMSLSEKTGSILNKLKTVHSIPADTTSVQCIGCGFQQGNVVLYVDEKILKRAKPSSSWKLGQNRYCEYYGFENGGLIHARLEDKKHHQPQGVSCARAFDKPAIISSVWSLHNLYHLLNDLLLPAYTTLARNGYHDTKQAILFIDVGHAEERSKLQQLLSAGRSSDTPLRLLFLFFNEIYAYEALKELPGTTCFKHLFLETDISETPHFYAFSHPPEASVLTSISDLGSNITWEFKSLLNEMLEIFFQKEEEQQQRQADGSRTKTFTTSIVQRKGTRKIERINDVNQAIRDAYIEANITHGKVKNVVLERVPFSKQYRILRDTDLFICVHGQGCSNLIFLRPDAHFILIMPLGWFGWRWMYGNFAIASGLKHVHFYRFPNISNSPNEGWDGTDSDYLDSNIYGVHPIRDQNIFLNTTHFRQFIAEKLMGSV